MCGDAKKVECPKCHTAAVHPAAVRQSPGLPGIVDVGWMCKSCGHEWGFEI